MSIFDEAKKMAAGMAEQVLKEKTGMSIDLDGSDQAAAPAEEEAAVEEEATVEEAAEEEATEEEATEEVVAEAEEPAPAPAGGLMDQVIGMAKNAGMGMVEQKLNMDLDGDGTVGQ